MVSVLEENCGPDIYCLPKADDTWVMGKLPSGMIRWNHNHPLFKVQGYVDVRLFEMTDTRKPVKEWINIHNNDGLLTVSLTKDTDWFALTHGNRENTSIMRQFRFLITPHGDWAEHQPWGPIFNIEEPPSFAIQPSNTHATESGKLARDALTPYGAKPTSTNIEVMIIRRRHPPKTISLTFDDVGTLPTHGPDSSDEKKNLEADGGSHQLIGTDSDQTPNSLRLTVKDARMIADTYRQLLRKPSWSGRDIETPQRTKSYYSDELMKRELAAEGTGVKHVTWTTLSAPETVPEDQEWSRNSIFVESSA
ncbi:hypothetical protein K493DRAFT_343781 [Basidiobolus meristosporus CBS 931.73]|uniref:Uncharacterized protein n=1 Tax=Basidiobolus meristosporus CBS 931.73 TaxID=1314790 RepID=A0A1Y1XEF7_9FUNG|nr:hypothetical protein K493DRAFT_360835 [Basidiobolus meristosporus CBS 931.73]ORY07987.1 hypothetical protein K493DRAFT_343781 [Basidiobolus meristosporus CBS 931.73]|eukprot:ORX84103.1 hypothetical protein K493DRAFT_360835 [Basidiobolus meristosporus CBS 931.73]